MTLVSYTSIEKIHRFLTIHAPYVISGRVTRSAVGNLAEEEEVVKETGRAQDLSSEGNRVGVPGY
jgi:hypothetical protein